MSYDDAVNWIVGLTNYERSPGRSRDYRLDRTQRLLEQVGNPHLTVPVVHIAGTKGKGSVAAMCAAILQAAGFRIGLFTSPHVTRFEERLQVDRDQPTAAEFIDLVNELRSVSGDIGLRPTYFEAALVLAWCFFRDRSVDGAVLEVGLGGRLDATNVCSPRVSVITSISLDHTNVLGNTVELIAREKAGIIKPAVPVISGVVRTGPREVIRGVARERKCALQELRHEIIVAATDTSATISTPQATHNGVAVPLPGRHQVDNAALATAAAEVFAAGTESRIRTETIRDAFGSLLWPVRIEVVAEDPVTIVDAAHNEASVAALIDTLDEHWPQQRPRVAIFAGTRGKDLKSMLGRVLTAFDTVVLTEYSDNPRAFPLNDLISLAESLEGPAGKTTAAPTPAAAFDKADSVRDRALICTTGSFFIAAEMRELLQHKGRTA